MRSLNYVQSYSLVFDHQFQVNQQLYDVIRDLQIFSNRCSIDGNTDRVLINSKEPKLQFISIVRLDDICPIFFIDKCNPSSYYIYSNDFISSDFFRDFLINYNGEFGLLAKLNDKNKLFLIYVEISSNDQGEYDNNNDNDDNINIKLISLSLDPDIEKLLKSFKNNSKNHLSDSINNQFIDGIILDQELLHNVNEIEKKAKYRAQINKNNSLISQSSLVNNQNINILDNFIKRRKLPSYLKSNINNNNSFFDDTDNDDSNENTSNNTSNHNINDNNSTVTDSFIDKKSNDKKSNDKNSNGIDSDNNKDGEKLKIDIQRIILLGLRIRNINKKNDEKEFQRIYQQTYKSTRFAIRNKKQTSKDELRSIVETLLNIFC